MTADLGDYLNEFAGLETRSNLRFWNAANSGEAADFDEYTASALALRRLHSDKERYRRFTGYLERADELDPLTRRSLEVAVLAFKENQLPPELLTQMVQTSTEIERLFNTFRAEVDGRKMANNHLLDALKKEKDSTRRKTLWEGLKQVGQAVGPRLRELAALRNRAARHLGYANYWEMQIRLQEHDPVQLLAMFDELEALTAEPFREMKTTLDRELAARFGISEQEIMPWHYDNPFFQDAPPSSRVNLDDFYSNLDKEKVMSIAGTFYRDLGLGAEEIIARSDLYERVGKDQHAFCISIDRGDDVRTLLNIRPTARWMETALHELGHGVYYVYIDPSLPFNLREAAHIFTTEAIAMLFGALAKNPAWMVEYAGVSPELAEETGPAIMEQRRREQLIFARFAMVMLHFEKALYENPDQDLNRLWWDTVERFQMLRRPEGRQAPDWASKPHFTIAPVYYHNYLLGEVLASQIRHVLAAMAGYEGPRAGLSFGRRKDFGEFLVQRIFRPGMRMPWPELVKQATGEALTVKYFGAELEP